MAQWPPALDSAVLFVTDLRPFTERPHTDYIVVHCAMTPPDMDIGVSEIDQWHRDRGWNGIGYHYVIRRDASVEQGRPDDVQGSHVKGFNNLTIGVCLVGGHKGFDYTRGQMEALERLLNSLLLKYKRARVTGHRDLDAYKECPWFDVGVWWDR